MDFSTVDRALTSLSRRHPPLSNEVIDLSQSLLQLLQQQNFDDLSDNEEYAREILRLIELGSAVSDCNVTTTNGDDKIDTSSAVVRWESLAVGMRLVVDYLEKRTGELPAVQVVSGEPGKNVYDDEEDEGT